MVDIGAEGRRSDGGIFASSDIGIGLENKSLDIPDPVAHFPYFLVGDAAFPMSTHLLKPYPGILHGDIQKTVFNYRLSRARRTIENSFGILAAKWRIFRSPIEAELSTAHLIIKASVCLHNFVLIAEENSPTKIYCPAQFIDREVNGKLLLGDWRKVVSSDGCFVDGRSLGSNFSSRTARNLRDSLAEYFCTAEGSVNWQYESIAKQVIIK